MRILTQSSAVRPADPWNSTAALLRTNDAPAGREVAWAEALAFIHADDLKGAHLISSVIVVDADRLVLLARHRRYGRWGPIGGPVHQGDSSLSAGGAREVLEEA